MIPILFDGSETDFADYGLGALSDCISCLVTEERNGIYELEMEYPVDGIHYEEIAHSHIIFVKPSEDNDAQAFRIYKISTPINGVVTINAEHISYQLNFIPTGGATATSCINAMNGLKNNAYESCPFTFASDNNTSGSYSQNSPASIRSRLGGSDGSVLDVFGGEFEWDNFVVHNWESRGADNGVTLRYGKNITDIKQEENIENTVTGVCPFWLGQDESGNDILVTLSEHVLHAATASLYPFQRTMVLDCSSEFESQPAEADLRTYANNYMTLNNIGYPSVSIDISFVALWQTEEYADVAPLEKVGLCDYVHVYYEKLGIEATAKVIKTEYDSLLERYTKITLGDAKSTLGDTIRGQIENETRDKVTSQAMMNAVQRATSLITGNSGGYVRFQYDETTGLPYEILIMDTQDIDTATKVWRWNKSGLGYSSTGYDGTYGLAMTQDGAIVANFITSGTINAVNFEAVNDITGYYTKINTSTGKLTWNMANSSMDSNGSLTATNGTFSGSITATGGTISGNLHITSGGSIYGDTYTLSSSNLTINGYTFTSYDGGVGLNGNFGLTSGYFVSQPFTGGGVYMKGVVSNDVAYLWASNDGTYGYLHAHLSGGGDVSWVVM